MRKRNITPTPETIRSRGEGWLDIERAALVELTSEEPDYPIESAFASGKTRDWRAATGGSQTMRLVFDQPQRLKRRSLVFEENEEPRTQEFTLRWSSSGGNSFQKIVRQVEFQSTQEEKKGAKKSRTVGLCPPPQSQLNRSTLRAVA